MPEDTSLVLVGESPPVLSGGSSAFHRGLFSCDSYGTCQVVVGDSGFLSSWDR